MEIEQIAPKKPNFLLVVLLAAGTILALFLLAITFLHWDGKHLSFRHTHSQMTSQLPAPQAQDDLYRASPV